MIVCDNSSLFEINLGWELLVAASHHGGWERKARLPAGKQVSVFRLLPEAEAGAPGAPGGCPGGGARQGGLIFPVFALGTSKRSGQGPQHGLSPPPTPAGNSKRMAAPIQGTDVPGAKDPAGGGAPKTQGLAGTDQHRHQQPWLGHQGLGGGEGDVRMGRSHSIQSALEPCGPEQLDLSPHRGPS